MRLREVLMLLLLASPAAADTGRWRAVAEPPRPGLPPVEVELGYAGGYISMESSPIDLRARTTQPFDGYIGYHLAVQNKRTVEIPVVARAVLGPNAQWHFATTLGMSSFLREPFRWVALQKRELVIEWRNRNRKVIATRSVGAPPWSERQRPLRISATNPATSTQPQWYAGFSSVIVPTDVWFSLPMNVREAIFRSPVRVRFYGAPSQPPRMTELDRALLPVEFGANGSWRAKPRTTAVGEPSAPDLVMSGPATFAASEDGARGDEPLMPKFAATEYPSVAPRGIKPSVLELFAEFRALVTMALLTVASIAAWLLMRRRPRFALALVACVITAATVMGRDVVRRRSATHFAEQVSIVAPGVVQIKTLRHERGSSPQAVSAAEGAAAGRTITKVLDETADVEVRTSNTAPGFGAFYRSRSWDASARSSVRRELGSPARIDVVSVDAKHLTVRWQSDMPVDYVTATWAVPGRRAYGAARTRGSRSGEVTLETGTLISPRLEFWWWLHDVPPFAMAPLGAPVVSLVRVTRDRTVVVTDVASRDVVRGTPPYNIDAPIRRNESGAMEINFLMPQPLRAQDVLIVFPADREIAKRSDIAFEISGPGGAIRQTLDPRTHAVQLTGADVARIAPRGGVVKLAMHGLPAETRSAGVTIQVREKKV